MDSQEQRIRALSARLQEIKEHGPALENRAHELLDKLSSSQQSLEQENERLIAENAAMRRLLTWVASLLANNNDYDDLLDWQQQYAAFLAAHPA